MELRVLYSSPYIPIVIYSNILPCTHAAISIQNVVKFYKFCININYHYGEGETSITKTFHILINITAKERHSRLHSHRYIFPNTALYICRILLCNWWNIGTRRVSGIIKSSRRIRFINKEYNIQEIGAVYHNNPNGWSNLIEKIYKFTKIKIFQIISIYVFNYITITVTATKVKATHIPYPTPAPARAHRAMSISPLTYISLVVDICPSLQQRLHNGEMPITRGPEEGRHPILHHIDRHGYILVLLLIHT